MNRNTKRVNMLMKKSAVSAMAGAVALLNLAGCSASYYGGDTAPAADITADTQAAVSESAVNYHGQSDGKRETVYMIADGSGNVTDTIVSAWLSNPSESEQIVDSCELENVENLKGDETFTKNENGDLVWNAGGRDIYYRGTTDKQAPVSVKITYTLDGEEIEPAQLAGRSGHLVMTFTYTNNLSKTVKSEDGEYTVYQPFTVVSGALFDNTGVSNIEVTNGRAINDGSRTAVVGVAFPGLSQSLGLDSLKDEDISRIEIPESVTISADVVDFSLMATITVEDNSLLKSALNDSEGFNLDDLRDSLNELTDAATQLVDGASDVADGAQALADGAAELSDGAVTLSDGAAAAADGASKVNDGAQALAAGAKDAKNGSAALADGAAKADEGAKTLNAGISSAYEGAQSLDAGIAQVRDGAQALDAGLSQLQQSMAPMSDGIVSLAGGAASIAAGAMSGDAQAPGIYEAASAIKDGLTAASRALTDSTSQACTALGAASQYEQAAIEQITALAQTGAITPEQAQAIITNITTGKMISDGVNEKLAATDMTTQFAGALGGLDAIMNGAQAINAGAQDMGAGLGALGDGAAALGAGVGQLKDGAAALSGGSVKLAEGSGALVSGMSQLQSGSASLSDGVSALSQGAAALDTGLGTLSDGADTLANGTKELSDGVNALADGADQLKDGTAQLSDGAVQLADGAAQLSDGMDEFNEKAISRLVSFAENDAFALADRVKAIADFAGEYHSFAAGDEDTDVRFIIRTEGIGE